MTRTRSVPEIARRFAEDMNRVACRGKCFVLVRGNKPMAELRSFPAGKRLAELPVLLASLPRLPSAEATQFVDELPVARESLARTEVHDYGRQPEAD